MKRAACFLALLLVPLTAQADDSDVCIAIATDPEVEAHFAETRSKELSVDGKRYYVDYSRPGGSCINETVWVETPRNPPKQYYYRCSENGCGFGAQASIVQWKDDLYILTERSRHSGALEKVSGWDKLSSQEQAKIRFRNLTRGIYKIDPETNYATNVCEGYYYPRPVQEKLVNGDKWCMALMNGQVKSLFPPSISAQRRSKRLSLVNTHNFRPSSLWMLDGYYIDLNQKVEVDLNKDGNKETVIPIERNSGKGCGCDEWGVNLLDKNDEFLLPQDDFSKDFVSFGTSINCGEKVDVIADYGQNFYFEKKNTRAGTREFFRLPRRDTPPECSYVNEAPLLRYPKN